MDGSKPIQHFAKASKARKSTRKLIVFQTVTLDDGSELSGPGSCKEVDGVETVTIVDKDGQSHGVPKSRVVSQKAHTQSLSKRFLMVYSWHIN